MDPARIDPDTTWQKRPEDRGWYGWGDGYTVAVDASSFSMSIGPSDYGRHGLPSLADAVTEARDVRRLVMGQ